MTDSRNERSVLGSLVTRRLLVNGAAALAAGVATGCPGLAMAASKPLDISGVVARIAAPFAKAGFNGGLGGFFYTPLGGTLVGGLTTDEGSVIADGFQAGFYLPLFESNANGASGKGYDAFLFINGLLFDSSKQAATAGAALLALEKPNGVKIAAGKLDDGAAVSSYAWTGAIAGFDANLCLSCGGHDRQGALPDRLGSLQSCPIERLDRRSQNWHLKSDRREQDRDSAGGSGHSD